MYAAFILLHVLAATVWTGGHLVLSLTILPGAIREKSPAELLRFESAYERVGLPALLIQALTGVWLAYQMIPSVGQWFAFEDPISSFIGTKLLLLAVTIALAADTRLRIIPRLSVDNLSALAWRIIPVTAISVAFVVIGVYFRTGWLS